MSCQMTFLPQSVNKIVCRSTVDLLSVYGNCPSQLPKILRQVIALVPAATTYTTGDSPGVPPITSIWQRVGLTPALLATLLLHYPKNG